MVSSASWTGAVQAKIQGIYIFSVFNGRSTKNKAETFGH